MGVWLQRKERQFIWLWTWADKRMIRILTKTMDYLDHFARLKRKENVEAVERLLSSHKELAKFERAQLGTYPLQLSLLLPSLRICHIYSSLPISIQRAPVYPLLHEVQTPLLWRRTNAPLPPR
jgi:hypothetical protein